jgi:hypothetical protein
LSPDFQAILLSYFGQEILANSATLFAALSGAFIFIHYLRPKEWSHFAWRILFSIIAALLVTGAIYSGFRIICYGQLAYLVMAGPTDVSKYSTLSQYYHAIVDVAGGRASAPTLYRVAWIFYYPLNEALPYIGSIWGVLTIVALCLLSTSEIHSPFSMPKRLVKPCERLEDHRLAITIGIMILLVIAGWVFLPH